MAEVIWRRDALNDLDEIIRYIDQFDPAAADDIGTRLFNLGESLADFPQRGRPADGDTRELTSVPPYVLRYEADEKLVSILGIRHGRRRPVKSRRA